MSNQKLRLEDIRIAIRFQIHHNNLQWKTVGCKKREDFNVIIVGSGIGGICLGKKLIELGIRLVLLDQVGLTFSPIRLTN